MLAQPLPDGRVPVLLSAHDETLISQDARAILDYLDRVGDGPRSDVGGRVHPATSATGAAAPCGGAGRGSRRTGGRPVRAGPRRRASAGRPVVEKRCAIVSRSCSPARATSGSRWAQMPTGDCRPTVREADRCAAGVRRGRVAVAAALPAGRAAAELVADPDSGSAVHPCGQFGAAVAILRSASRYHRRTQPRRGRGGLCGREDLVIRCGRTGRCARCGRRPVDRAIRHGSARCRRRRGAGA